MNGYIVPYKATYIPIKTRLFEQSLSLKRDEFDVYTCLLVAIQRARNIFIREVTKFGDVFNSVCHKEGYSNFMQTVKRTIRNIIETNLGRQLKLPKDIKRQKIFQMLMSNNDDILYRRK